VMALERGIINAASGSVSSGPEQGRWGNSSVSNELQYCS